MSRKMFFQIVLLIIIAAVVLLGSKMATRKCGFQYRMQKMQMQKPGK